MSGTFQGKNSPLATPNTVAIRDTNANTAVNAAIENVNIVVSANSTTSLNVASAPIQIITGTQSQIFNLPNATTLVVNQSYKFINSGTESITLKTGDGTILTTIKAGYVTTVYCSNIDTVAGTWVVTPFLGNFTISTATGGAISAVITSAGLTDGAGITYSILNNGSAVLTLTADSISGYTAFPASATATSVVIPVGGSVFIETEDVGTQYRVVSVSNQGVSGNVFSAGQTTAQSIPNNTTTKINLGVVIYDPLTQLVNAGSRFQPKTAGFYQINGAVRFAYQSTTGERECQIWKNGAVAIQGTAVNARSDGQTSVTAAGVIYMNGTTDYVELVAYQSSGSVVSLDVSNSVYNTLNGFLVLASSGNIPSNAVSRAIVSTNQTIPSGGSGTQVNFTTQVDPNNWLNPTNGKFQPTQAGYYQITGSTAYSSCPSGSAYVQLILNKNSTIISNDILSGTSGNGGCQLELNDVVYLNGTTDYLTFQAYQNTGSNMTLINTAGSFFTFALIGGVPGSGGNASNYTISTAISGTIPATIATGGFTDSVGATFSILNTSTTNTLTLTANIISGYTAFPANANNANIVIPAGQSALIETEVVGNQYRLITIGSQQVSGNIFTTNLVSQGAIPNAASILVNFVSTSDPLNQFNNVNHSFKPTTAGYYQINATLMYETNTTGSRLVTVFKNGSVIVTGEVVAGVGYIAPSVSTLVYLNGTTDVVTVNAYQDSGVSVPLANNGCSFSGFLVMASNGNIPSNSVARATISSSSQSITSNVSTKIQLQTKVFDSNGWFNTTNSRFQPTQAGYYLFTGSVELRMTSGNFGDADRIETFLYKNGNGDSYSQRYNGTNVDSYLQQQVSSLIYLNGSSDYVELWVKKTSGGTVVVNNNQATTYLTAALVGGAPSSGYGNASNYTISTATSGTIPATILSSSLSDSVGATYSILNTSATNVLTLTATTISGYTAYPANATATSIAIPAGQSALIETEVIGTKYRLVSIGSQAVSGNLFTGVGATNLSIPTNVNTKIDITSTSDPLNQFNNLLNRFQPTVAGYYQLNGAVRYTFLASPIGERSIWVMKNGAIFALKGTNVAANGQSPTGLTVSGIVYFNGTTDYAELYTFQSNGINVITESGGNLFSGSLIMGANGNSSSGNIPRFGSRTAPDSLGYMFIQGANIYTVGAGSSNGNWLPYGVISNNFTPTVAPINNTGAPITGWADLYSDYENGLALTNDGRVFAVGLFYSNNVWGQVPFPGGVLISKIYSVLARDQYNGITYYAIDTAGKLYAWGNGNWGQLGQGNITYRPTPQLVNNLSSKTIVDLAVSANNGVNVIALDSTGQIYTWGYGGGGGGPNGSPLGNGTLGVDINIPYTVPGMNSVAKISAGGDYNGSNALNFSRVINNDGTSWATGTNYYGVLGLGNTTGKSVFTQEVLNKTDWVVTGALPTYRGASYAIDANGTLYFCGRNHDGCLGFPTQINVDILTFTAPTADFQGKMLQGSSTITPKVISLGNCNMGANTVAVLDNTGTLYTCGYNGYGQCANGTTTNVTSFGKVIGIPSTRKVIDVIATGYPSNSLGMVVILDDGTMMGCGDTDYGAQGNTVNPSGNGIPVFQYVIGYDNSSSGSSTTNITSGNSNYTVSTSTSTTIPATISTAGITDSLGATYSILNTSATLPITLTATTFTGFTAFASNASLNSLTLLPGQSALIETELAGTRYRIVTLSSSYIAAQYASYISNNDQTGATSGSNVVFQTMQTLQGNAISVNTTTGVITLQPGYTYRLRGSVGDFLNAGSFADCYAGVRWKNVTTGFPFGSIGLNIAPTAPEYNAYGTQVAEGTITPLVPTQVALQVNLTGNISGVISNSYIPSWCEVMSISGQAMVATTYSQSVTCPVANNTALPTSSSSALSVLTYAIPYAGTWQISANVAASLAGSGECSFGLFTGGSLVANTVTQCCYIDGSSTFQGGSSGTWIVSTSGPANYTVGVWNVGSGVAYLNNSASGYTYGSFTQLGNTAISATNLITKASGIVNAGVPVVLGNLQVQMAPSGNRNLQVATLSGTYTVYGSDVYGTGTGNAYSGFISTPMTITTTMQSLLPSQSFTTAGWVDTWTLMDTTAKMAWRISMIVGFGFNNNMISIEQLV